VPPLFSPETPTTFAQHDSSTFMSQTKAEQLFKPLLLRYCAHIVCVMRRVREFGFSSSR